MRTGVLTVIDLSHWNPVTDWDAVAASGVVGVLHKFSQGADERDPAYVEHKAEAMSRGLLWGRYHFGDNSNVSAQVDNFLGGWTPGEALALDFERGNRTMLLTQARAFATMVLNRTGIWPLLYSGSLLKDDEYLGGEPGVLLHCRLWLAEYGPTAVLPRGWSSYWLWQDTDTGSVPGIKGNVDIDRFDGDLETLTKGWAV